MRRLHCPQCAEANLQELSQSIGGLCDVPAEDLPTSILRCERCGHVWMPARRAVGESRLTGITTRITTVLVDDAIR